MAPAKPPHVGQRVLVTGGLGFLGSNLALRLAVDGAEVTVLDARIAGSGANPANLEGSKVKMLHGDLLEAKVVRDAVATQDVVYHLAAQTGHAASMQDPLNDLDLNARATLQLLEACRAQAKPPAVVFASTRQVYGRPQRLPVAEDHPLAPPDVNAVHKLAAEQYLALYHQVHGLRTATVRLTNVYGPRMRIVDGRQMFLGVWMRNALEGKPFEVWGGTQRRDLLHVDDAVDAFVGIASNGAWGKTFNAGHAHAQSLRELADAVVAAVPGAKYTVKPMPAERAAIEIGDFATDASALRKATGWEPKVALADGLRQTADYFRGRLDAYVNGAA